MLGAIADIRISKNKNGEVNIDSYQAVPIVTHLEYGPGKITVYPLNDYTEELVNKNEIINQDSNFSKKYLENVWNQVFKDM